MWYLVSWCYPLHSSLRSPSILWWHWPPDFGICQEGSIHFRHCWVQSSVRLGQRPHQKNDLQASSQINSIPNPRSPLDEGRFRKGYFELELGLIEEFPKLQQVKESHFDFHRLSNVRKWDSRAREIVQGHRQKWRWRLDCRRD